MFYLLIMYLSFLGQIIFYGVNYQFYSALFAYREHEFTAILQPPPLPLRFLPYNGLVHLCCH